MSPETVDTFSRLEAQTKALTSSHVRRGEDRRQARPIRLKKGTRPDYSKLTSLQALAWRLFRERLQRQGAVNPQLEEDLLKAHMRLRADEYKAYTLFLFSYVGIPLGVALGILLAVFGIFALGLPLLLMVVPAALLAVAVPFLIRAVMDSAPASKARARGRAIDRRISAVLSFVSAMASADVNVDTIFKELSKQKLYGEVAEEAAWITRDTELLGIDILTAMKEGAKRTPSRRWQDFLQGVVTTATSGGQLKPYFLLKADQYEKENKLDLLKRVETMGLLAETFVITVVAFPLFLIIMLAIFAVVGTQGPGMVVALFAIVGIIPLFQAAFIYIILQISKEGQQ
jgi:flagellar protein FlaJ